LWINPLIYAEVSVSFSPIEDLEAALPAEDFRRAQLPWEAAFLAGVSLLTRDGSRNRTYFPTVDLITPTSS
jgi:hypothetical protein